MTCDVIVVTLFSYVTHKESMQARELSLVRQAPDLNSNLWAQLEKFAKVKRSRLFGLFVSDKKVLEH